MLEFGLLVFFGGMALRISKILQSEAITLEIYEVPRTMQFLVFLFPAGPVLLLHGTVYVPFSLGALGALLCYLPTMLLARKQAHRLQTAGTDRVARAENAISEALGVALAGVVFVVAATAITWGAKSVAPIA